MPPLYRIIEVTVYSLLNFFPLLILALYPFRQQLRFPMPVTVTLIGILTVIQVGIGTVAAFSGQHVNILSAVNTGVYAVLYFAAVKAHWGKKLFTLLMLSNVANFIVVGSKCLEGVLFGDLALESYRWSFSVCMVIVHLLITLPLFFYFRKIYSDGINKASGAKSWYYLWLIPATFYLMWFHHLYGREETSLEICLQPDHTLFLFLIDLGSFLVYHMVIQLINEHDKNIRLNAQNHQLAMQNLQYDNLQDRISKAQQAKHDIRHHVTVIDSYLQSGDFENLRAYLQSYKKSLPDENDSILFCKHYAINTLLSYFQQTANSRGIEFTAAVAVPQQISIPDDALSVVLGNLLENALEACGTVTDRPARISINGRTESGAIFFEIDNTYSGELKRDKNGRYLSTKHRGYGIGLVSAADIVSQYEGLFEIETKDGMFSASLLMNIPESSPETP